MTPDLNAVFARHQAQLRSGERVTLHTVQLGEVTVPSGRIAITAQAQDLRELVSAEVAPGSYAVEAEVAGDRLVAVTLRLGAELPERWEPAWTLSHEPWVIADRSLLLEAELGGAEWEDEWSDWVDRGAGHARAFSVGRGRLVAAARAFPLVPFVYRGFRGAKIVALALTCGELWGEDGSYEGLSEPDYRRLLPRAELLTSLGEAVNAAREGSPRRLFDLAADEVVVSQGGRSLRGREGLKELLELLPTGVIELRAPLFPEGDSVALSLAVLPRVSRVLGEIEVSGFEHITRIALPEAFVEEDPPSRAGVSTAADEELIAALAKLELRPLQAVFLRDLQTKIAGGGELTEGQRQRARAMLG